MKPRDLSNPQVDTEIKTQDDVNRLNQEGLGLLHIAVLGHDTDSVTALLKNTQLDINRTDKNGRTAAFIAAQYGNDKILKLLAEAKANLTQPNYFNCSPFEIAAYRKYQKVLDALTELKVAPPASQEQKIPADYKALYDLAELVQGYPKRKIRQIGAESEEEEKRRIENEAQCDKFEIQFRLLLDKYKQWGQATKQGCDEQKLLVKIDGLKGSFFNENYSGDQPPLFFNTIKQNMEQIWFILQLDKSVSDKKKIEEFKKLCYNMYVCAPGFYTHVEHALNNLTAKVAIDYWLAELRTNIINQYADRHVRKYKITDGFSPHIFTEFLIYALNEGWAPLSKITREIEVFADSKQAHIDKNKTFNSLTKYFEKSYTPLTIADCVAANVFLAIRKIRDNLNLEEVKGQGISATPEFLSEMRKLVNTFNLKAEDISFFDFSDDGRYALFNPEMFKAIFLKSCKENGTYFPKESWHEISLPGGYKFYNCQHQAGWFEKEDKPYNIIMNWRQPQEAIEPLVLLGELVGRLPFNELPAIKNLRSLLNDGVDLMNFIRAIPGRSIAQILEIFFDVEAGDHPLKLALKKGDELLINILFDIHVQSKSKLGWNPLHYAIEQGNIVGIKVLSEREPIYMHSISFINSWGCTSIVVAVMNNRPDILKLLIDLNADITEKNTYALHLAASLGNVEMIKLLCELKADMNHRDMTKWTALYHAVDKKGDNSDIIKTLLACKVDTKLKDYQGLTVLHYAIKYGKFNTLQFFAENKDVDFNIPNARGLTPFQYALDFGCLNSAKELLRLNKGEDINKPDLKGCSILFKAAGNGEAGKVKLLLELKADANQANFFGCTPYEIASIHDRKHVLEMLKQHTKPPVILDQIETDLTAKVSIAYWLAEFRTNIISEFAQSHSAVSRKGCLIYARKEGLAPLAKSKEDFIEDKMQNQIDKPSALELQKHFKASYTPQTIANCVSTNVISIINEFSNVLSLKEEKSDGVRVIPEFFAVVDSFFKKLNVKLEDTRSLFDFSDDGKIAHFNPQMFKAIFLRSCKENSKYFPKEYWMEGVLPDGFKFCACQNEEVWFEKEDKPSNIIVNMNCPQKDIVPAKLLAQLVSKVEAQFFPALGKYRHIINSAESLTNFITHIDLLSREECWNYVMKILMDMTPAISFQLGETTQKILAKCIFPLTNAYIAMLKQLDEKDPKRYLILARVENKENLFGILLHKSPQAHSIFARATESKSDTKKGYKIR